MEIRATRGGRIWLVIGGLAFAAASLAYPIVLSHSVGGWLVLYTPPFALGIGIALGGALPTYLRADDSTLTFHPSVGRTRSFARSSLGGIVRVVNRGTSFQFRDVSGRRLLRTSMSFRRQDMESLANFLRVPCYWDYDGIAINFFPPNASWDDFRAYQDQIAEAERHVER